MKGSSSRSCGLAVADPLAADGASMKGSSSRSCGLPDAVLVADDVRRASMKGSSSRSCGTAAV